MSLLALLLPLVILGVILYLVESYIPMSPPIQTVIRVVVVLALIVWLLQGFGVTGTSFRFR